MRQRHVAYVFGCYKAPTIYEIQHNIMAARAVAIELWRQGWAVICPHTNTALFDGSVYPEDPEADRQTWLRGDLEIIRRLVAGDVLVSVPRWEQSEGALGEAAEAMGRPPEVYHWPEDREVLAQLALAETPRPVNYVDTIPDSPDD